MSSILPKNERKNAYEGNKYLWYQPIVHQCNVHFTVRKFVISRLNRNRYCKIQTTHYCLLYPIQQVVPKGKVYVIIQKLHSVRGQNVFIYLALAERNTQVKFDLKLSVYSLGMEI